MAFGPRLDRIPAVMTLELVDMNSPASRRIGRKGHRPEHNVGRLRGILRTNVLWGRHHWVQDDKPLRLQ